MFKILFIIVLTMMSFNIANARIIINDGRPIVEFPNVGNNPFAKKDAKKTEYIIAFCTYGLKMKIYAYKTFPLAENRIGFILMNGHKYATYYTKEKGCSVVRGSTLVDVEKAIKPFVDNYSGPIYKIGKPTK